MTDAGIVFAVLAVWAFSVLAIRFAQGTVERPIDRAALLRDDGRKR